MPVLGVLGPLSIRKLRFCLHFVFADVHNKCALCSRCACESSPSVALQHDDIIQLNDVYMRDDGIFANKTRTD